MRDGGSARGTTNGTRRATAAAGVDDDEGADDGLGSSRGWAGVVDVLDGSAGRSKPKEKDILVEEENTCLFVLVRCDGEDAVSKWLKNLLASAGEEARGLWGG